MTADSPPNANHLVSNQQLASTPCSVQDVLDRQLSSADQETHYEWDSPVSTFYIPPFDSPDKTTSIHNHVNVDGASGEDEATCSNSFESPNGTIYYTPIVPEVFKPIIDSRHENWDSIVPIYKEYAKLAGFATTIGQSKRHPKTGEITHRSIRCSRGQKSENQVIDTSGISPAKISSFKRTDCKAILKAKICKNSTLWEVYKFEQVHNHGLISQDDMDLATKRKLEFCDQEYIARCRLANIGPAKAHRLQVALKGGHQNVRGTRTDWKNWERDRRYWIGGRDAQMFVDKMTERSQTKENFTFKFLASDKKLRCIFWADDVSKRNYQAFGDVCGFDATYDTNLYKLVFVPFTGVDNHKSCVTFGAGLIFDETIQSYEWLLQNFLDAHEKKEPLIMLTDQDAAMQSAVLKVFKKAQHRLCMWHITEKLPTKILGDTLNNTTLRATFHKLVWNVYIKPSTFEERWNTMIEQFGMQDNEWLSTMYRRREEWIPSYFRDVPMCCLMKTTSRCESANHQFKMNSSATNNLVQFLLCFDSIIDGQRHDQRVLELRSSSSSPKYITSLPIERTAASIYTRDIFKCVQKEIHKSIHQCYIATRSEADGIFSYTVAHQDSRREIINEFSVTFDPSDTTVRCSCRSYTRIGYLCRHVFCAFRHHNIQGIPDHYVHNRWRRDVLPRCVFGSSHRYGVDNSKVSILRHRIVDNIEKCAARLRSDEVKLALLDQKIQQITDDIFKEIPFDPAHKNKGAVIQEINKVNDPQIVDIEPPTGIRNKGCGTKRRRIGPGEKAKELSNKAPRLCNYCNELVLDHDSRNCPVMKADLAILKASESEDQVGNAAEPEVQNTIRVSNRGKKLKPCKYCHKMVNDHDTRSCPEKKKDALKLKEAKKRIDAKKQQDSRTKKKAHYKSTLLDENSEDEDVDDDYIEDVG